ncbi:uncharacterized protein Fot_57326 [Forsythia ovata]|uniref:Uncharacterized protein n=1 Tax=Forsythia ovata TaxID=205694 RepID=A0ABD1NVU9_9LAMI
MGLFLTREMKSFSSFVVVLMLLFSVQFVVEARPLNGASVYNLSLINAVKAGPSPGEGHKFTNAKTLGGIKESGPSPGEGHKFTNAKTLGGIKESGPSPGEGHKFTNAKTLGGVKDSGPSPGEGNKFTNAHTLGGVKESGPSPGHRSPAPGAGEIRPTAEVSAGGPLMIKQPLSSTAHLLTPQRWAEFHLPLGAADVALHD